MSRPSNDLLESRVFFIYNSRNFLDTKISSILTSSPSSKLKSFKSATNKWIK
ncbi:MAG TPA: hypothetical protein VGB37_14745 [Candidatus Lokiarchaeia archaeon]